MTDYRTQLHHMRDELLARAATTDAQAAVVELINPRSGDRREWTPCNPKQQLQRIEAALKTY